MRTEKYQSPDITRKMQGQRQLQVGTIIRNALADILMRGSFAQNNSESTKVTIFGVDMSPDLKIATVYVVPFSHHTSNTHDANHATLEALENEQRGIRKLLAKRVHLKFIPALRFRIDTSPTQAAHIDDLLKSPKIARDLEKNAK